MITDETKSDWLRSIQLKGGIDNIKVNPIINYTEPDKILNLSHGAARIKTNLIKKFAFIVIRPRELDALEYQNIRCCLCRKVINYPCWYYKISYVVNVFHYFICLDSSSLDKPTTACYKR